MYLCERYGVKRILSLLPLRTTTPSLWHTVHVIIPHDMVGGISTWEVPVHFSWNSSKFAPLGALPTLADLSPLVPWDVSTILDSTVLTRHLCAAPPTTWVVPLRAEVVPTNRDRVYHGGGLLPPTFTLATLITTPTIWRDQRVTWGIRPLTKKEFLSALDHPGDSASHILSQRFEHWERLVPMACL